MGDSNLLNEQFGAISQSINLGRTLQKEHPEIADIYGYYSQVDIPEMLDIQSKYGVGDDIAMNGVHFAIIGHEEGFGIESYVGLITDEEELKRLREGRMANGGLNGNIAQGHTFWSDEEKEYAYLLSQEQEFQLGSQVNNQLIAFALNIEYYGCKEVRSTSAVHTQLCSYRKSLDDVVA